MTWRDAFKKAVAATGWMLIFIIIFGAIVGIGVVLGALSPLWQSRVSVGGVIAGWILMLIGYIGLLFGGMAISFKFMSEAVADTIMKRLYPPGASAQPQAPPPQQALPAK